VTGILWAASVVGAGLWGLSLGDDRATARQARETSIEQRATAAAANAAASAINAIKVTNRTIQNEVIRDVVEKPVYRDCLHDADSLRRINAAITGKPEPVGSGIVPGTDPAKGLKFWRDDAQADRGGRAVP
jgi:hypothetical protein